MADEQEGKIEAAVGVVAQNGAIVLVEAELLPGDKTNKNTESGNSFSVSLLPSTTVQELKTVVYEKLGVPEKEQRLVTDETPLLGGTLADAASPNGKLKVFVEQTAVDPRLGSLFDMVQLGDWKERDEIMAKMFQPRDPKSCRKGNPLTPLDAQDDERLGYQCEKCHIRFEGRTLMSGVIGPVQAHVCRCCSFSLCTRCFQNDKGSEACHDPYQSLQEFAVRLGSRLASFASWFGDRSHMCGHPEFTIHSEFAPQALRVTSFDKHAIRVSRPTQVLHKGIRLVVKWNDEARAFLVSSGLEAEMQETELDVICEDGATVEDMIQHRKPWKQAACGSAVIQALFDGWRNRFPTFSTVDGRPAQPYPTAKMLSFNLEKAVFEVGVQINDGDY